jgi:hypothetical protein
MLSLTFSGHPSRPHFGCAPSRGRGKGQWLSRQRRRLCRLYEKNCCKPFETGGGNAYVDGKEAGFHAIQVGLTRILVFRAMNLPDILRRVKW